jgi:hypothetical protein
MFGYEEEWEGYVASPWLDQPEPTIEQKCSYYGHTYHGDDRPDASDGMGGRCSCGEVRYPTGGPCRIEVRFDSTCMVLDAYWHCLTHDVSGDRRYETCDGAQEAAKWQHKISEGSAGETARRGAPDEGGLTGKRPSVEQRSATLGSPGGRTIGPSDRTSPGVRSAGVVPPHGSGSDPNRTGPPIAVSGNHSGDCRTPAGDSTDGDGAHLGGGPQAATRFVDAVPLVDERGPGSSLSDDPGPEGGEGAVYTPAPDLPTTSINPWKTARQWYEPLRSTIPVRGRQP